MKQIYEIVMTAREFLSLREILESTKHVSKLWLLKTAAFY